jgi:hypothetical protein
MKIKDKIRVVACEPYSPPTHARAGAAQSANHHSSGRDRFLLSIGGALGIASGPPPRPHNFVKVLSAVLNAVRASLVIVALLVAFLLMVPGGALLLAVLYLQRKKVTHVSP